VQKGFRYGRHDNRLGRGEGKKKQNRRRLKRRRKEKKREGDLVKDNCGTKRDGHLNPTPRCPGKELYKTDHLLSWFGKKGMKKDPL